MIYLVGVLWMLGFATCVIEDEPAVAMALMFVFPFIAFPMLEQVIGQVP